MEIESTTQLRDQLQEAWAEGPNAYSDVAHVDPDGLGSSTITGDIHLWQLLAQMNQTSSYLNMLYEWEPIYTKSKEKTLLYCHQGQFTAIPISTIPLGNLPTMNSDAISRLGEITNLYGQAQQHETVTQSNFLYMGMLDLLFGLKELEQTFGFQRDFLIKTPYTKTVLPQIFGQTLLYAHQSGFQVGKALFNLNRSTNSFLDQSGHVGYRATKRGEFVLIRDGIVIKQNGKSIKLPLETVLSEVERGSLFPASKTMDLAQSIAIAAGEVTVHHFGNSYGGIVGLPQELAKIGGVDLHTLPMVPDNQDKWSFVSVMGQSLNLPSVYLNLGKIGPAVLHILLEKKEPLGFEEIAPYQHHGN